MFYKAFFAATAALAVPALAHAGHHHDHAKRDYPTPHIVQAREVPFSSARFPDVQAIFEGNLRFRGQRNADAIQNLVDNGQSPPFMMFSCSDSRVPEATIFDSDPGTFFMSRNIANQYKSGDENAQSAMAYGIRVLGAQHVIVLGHYGCGGVAAAIATPPQTEIDVAANIISTWVGDIRGIYLTSTRPEVVAMRDQNSIIEARGETVAEPDDVRDPGFRALVEENVKDQVRRISQSSIISNLHDDLAKLGAARKREEAPLIPVFVHGFVHDIETGEVFDLGVSTGPPGFEFFAPGSTLTATPPDIISHGHHYINARSNARRSGNRRIRVRSRRSQS